MPHDREIPPIIHQSWKDADIPYHVYYKSWIESWSAAHPHWTRMFWTDQDNETLVREFYSEFYDFFLSLSPNIKKADFARYLYMHRYGGVYVDLDFICLKDLTPLLQGYEIVLGRLSPDNYYYQIPNAFLASRAGHPFWLSVARDARDAPPHERSVEAHTGPFRLQWAYYRYRPEKAVVYGDEVIYPLDWIHFTGWDNGRYFRKDRVQLAQDIRKKNSIREIAQLLPRSCCVTLWTHNWGE